jgi:hypothetical protein
LTLKFSQIMTPAQVSCSVLLLRKDILFDRNDIAM